MSCPRRRTARRTDDIDPHATTLKEHQPGRTSPGTTLASPPSPLRFSDPHGHRIGATKLIRYDARREVAVMHRSGKRRRGFSIRLIAIPFVLATALFAHTQTRPATTSPAPTEDDGPAYAIGRIELQYLRDNPGH